MTGSRNTTRTPPPEGQSTTVVSETPRVAKATGGGKNATDLRDNIVAEMMGEVLECPLQDFIANYAPFEPTEKEMAACRNALLQGDKPLLRNGKWEAFGIPPSTMTAVENKVFLSLTDISKRLRSVDLDAANSPGDAQVGRSAKRDGRPGFYYITTPNSPIPGEQDGSNNEIDGYFCNVYPESGKVTLGDVAVVCEYKKSKAQQHVQENRAQLVSAASHIMNQDPVRNAVFGVTIEDDLVSLWYFCRSHSAKSEPFSLVQDTDSLIMIFLWFMFGRREVLGFDPNICRIVPAPGSGGYISYVYRLTGTRGGVPYEEYYRTTKSLCDLHRLRVTGRATRVWEAQKVASFERPEPVDPNKTVVLRDLWLEDGAQTERDIQEEIFRDLDSFGKKLANAQEPGHFSAWDNELKNQIRSLFPGNPPQGGQTGQSNKTYRDYFLKILSDSVGDFCKDVPARYRMTPNVLRTTVQSNSVRASAEGADPSRNSQSSASVLGDPSTLLVPTPLRGPRQYLRKRPYRLVYEECCRDLDHTDVKSLRELFIGLRDCLLALALLYCAGWVHRDISCGNVLLWKSPERGLEGKLGDLEYAKRFPLRSMPPSSDPKTGTSFFMPVEIALGKHMSEETAVKKQKTSFDILKDLKAMAKGQIKSATQTASEPVRHNFLHDVESLFWLAVWAVTYRIGHFRPVLRIFVPCVNDYVTIMRKEWLSNHKTLMEALAELPPSVGTVRDYLNEARSAIYRRYIELSTPDLRENPEQHSMQYVLMYTLISCSMAAIPDDAPQLVKVDPQEVEHARRGLKLPVAQSSNKRGHGDP